MSTPATQKPVTTPAGPPAAGTGRAVWPQSLAKGAIGVALLHIERAHSGTGSWDAAHASLANATRHQLISDDHAGLFFGAPAVAFALHTAAFGTGRYQRALHALDTAVIALTRRRLEHAHARIDRGHRPRAAEFDLLYGITGLGAYLLGRDPHSEIVRHVLSYLVRLTEPLPADEEGLPGWWTSHAPMARAAYSFPRGHGNLGMAHGITGPLALLSLAARHGTTVDGHTGAIERVCAWLDALRQEGPVGPWWPQWITPADQHPRPRVQPGPPRPSWCYGTPGLARAQQLAGIALGDAGRQRMAEAAMLACLSDPAQLGQISDGGLCHGAAGLLCTVRRIAQDAPPGVFADHLPKLRALLADQEAAREDGLLEGRTGTALITENDGVPATGWDACLLLN